MYHTNRRGPRGLYTDLLQDDVFRGMFLIRRRSLKQAGIVCDGLSASLVVSVTG